MPQQPIMGELVFRSRIADLGAVWPHRRGPVSHMLCNPTQSSLAMWQHPAQSRSGLGLLAVSSMITSQSVYSKANAAKLNVTRLHRNIRSTIWCHRCNKTHVWPWYGRFHVDYYRLTLIYNCAKQSLPISFEEIVSVYHKTNCLPL